LVTLWASQPMQKGTRDQQNELRSELELAAACQGSTHTASPPAGACCSRPIASCGLLAQAHVLLLVGLVSVKRFLTQGVDSPVAHLCQAGACLAQRVALVALLPQDRDVDAPAAPASNRPVQSLAQTAAAACEAPLGSYRCCGGSAASTPHLPAKPCQALPSPT
jgi:hypothetical protein